MRKKAKDQITKRATSQKKIWMLQNKEKRVAKRNIVDIFELTSPSGTVSRATLSSSHRLLAGTLH